MQLGVHLREIINQKVKSKNPDGEREKKLKLTWIENLINNIFHFYYPWKRQKFFDFLMFPGGIEMEYWS